MYLIRLIFIALFIFIGYRLVKNAVAFLNRSRQEEAPEENTTLSADLVQDPQCEIYFMKQRGVEARIKGQTLHFCSEKCRDDYLKSHRLR